MIERLERRGLSSLASKLLCCLALLCAACQLPSVKTRDEALDVVRTMLVHPYTRDAYVQEARPDLELVALGSDSVSFAREQHRYAFRYQDVAEIDLVPEDGFPGHDRVTIELVLEPASYSARRLAEVEQPDTLTALLYSPRIRFPGRTRWQAARFRQAVRLLAADAKQGIQPPPVEPGPAPSNDTGLKAKLSELKECLDAGLISEEEYQQKKMELLDDF